MDSAPASTNVRISALERQLDTLEHLRARDRRALDVLHNISLACRGQTSFRAVFEAIRRELCDIFELDSCFIAVCDTRRIESFRAALLYDEGLIEFVHDVPYGPVTGRMIRERTPVLIDDLVVTLGDTPREQTAFGNTQKRSRGWMGVPLLIGEHAVGVISVQSYTPKRYDTNDLDLLQRLGQVVAVGLENVNLNQHQRELSQALAERVAARSGELTALSALAAEMVLQRPLPALLDHALTLIVPLFGVDGGSVRLLDPQRRVLALVAHNNFPDEYARATTEMTLDADPLNVVVGQNTPLVITDQAQHRLGLADTYPFKALLSVPLRIGSRTIGVLNLAAHQPRTFSDHQVDLGQVIGNQIAIAVENARLLDERERQIRELWALSSISHAAGTALDLPTLLRQVHEALRGFMQLDAFVMFVYDPRRQVIVEGIGIDEGEAYVYFRNQPPPPDSFTAWVIRNRQPLHMHNVAEEIGQYPGLRQNVMGAARAAVSWLGVPLFDRDHRVIGTIAVQSYNVAAFSEREARFLDNVARQVALHVQNVSLLIQRERQIHELDAIGRIGQLVSATFDLDDMLRLVYEELQQLTGASSFYLIVCDPGSFTISHAFYIDGGEPIDQALPDQRPPAGSLTEWILRERQPLLFSDLPAEEARLAALGIAPWTYGSAGRPHSWAGVPLLAQDKQPIGVIAIQDGQPYQYDQQTIEFLSQVASHLSLGVQKVNLFAAEQAARRSADTLREVARVLSTSFGSNEVLDLILNELRKVISYDSASIMLLDGQTLRMAARKSIDGSPHPAVTSFALGQTSGASLAVRRRRPIVIGDTQVAPEWTSRETSQRIRSWLGVPLIARGDVLGVLNIDSSRPYHFADRDVEVALAFARQAAVAIDNARLYQESVARVEQELEIARGIQSNLFPRSLPQVPGVTLAARCLPARETGGDFYDVLAVDDGDDGIARLGLIIGDASGKSIPGAMLMAIARSIVRSEARDHAEPEEVMREANRWITLDVPRRSFVALCYARFDLPRRRLVLANAGQLTPIRRRTDGQISYLDVPGPTLPLGIDQSIPYAAREIALEPGDTVVFYTDGIVEARDGHQALFGFERLEGLIRDGGDASPEAFIDRVLAEIARFGGGAPQHDDMTLLVLRIEGRSFPR